MKTLLWVAMGLALAGAGCASIKESDRQLNYQSKWAARLVEEKSTDPQLKQAGTDIRLNSEALEKTMGLPEKPVPYSPQNSASAREARDQEHRKRWYDFILPGALALLGGGGLLGVARKIFPTLLAGPLGTAAGALVEGIQNVRTQMEAAPDKKLDWGTVAGELAKVQDNAGVRELVKNLVVKVEDKLKS